MRAIFDLLELREIYSHFLVRSSLMKISLKHKLLSSNALGSWLQQHVRQGNGQSSRTSKQWFGTLFHLGGSPIPGPPNDRLIGGGNKGHPFPSIVGMGMGHFGHRQVYYIILFDCRISYSSPRCMRAMFDLSHTLQVSISSQLVGRRWGVLVVSKVLGELIASSEIPFRVGFLWWFWMSLQG